MIRVQLKLMGMLKEKAPADGVLELPEGASIADALERLQVAANSVQVFTVNGQLERSAARQLADGDELTLLPPVGGG